MCCSLQVASWCSEEAGVIETLRSRYREAIHLMMAETQQARTLHARLLVRHKAALHSLGEGERAAREAEAARQR